MANKPPIINIDTVARTGFGQGDAFAASLARLGPVLGMEKLGCTLVELEPGKKAWPYHLHYGAEELFIVLEGKGSLRYDDMEHDITTGDIIYTPPGEGTAHQIINTSKARLRYLALSTMETPELCYYPDSGKYGAYAFKPGAPRKAFIAREGSAAQYWDGESDA
jgi:uncharacterized cupin superfamily protein